MAMDVQFQPMKERPKVRPGCEYYRKSPFKGRTPMDELERELEHLKATDIVIESGHTRDQIRNDGWPRGGSAPAHCDVRLYFKCKHGALRYECNRFDSWEGNLRAIGLWMQRQRLAIEEWGIGAGGEAYRGFAALPASIQAEEWATAEDAARFLLQVEGFPNADDDEIAGVVLEPAGTWKGAAKKAHPDAGGSNELMSKVNRAKDFIEKSQGGSA
jgi:hypothetical protein